MSEAEKIRYECIAYHNWVGSLNKDGFPKNKDGSMMNCWQLYDYYTTQVEVEKKGAYFHHAVIHEAKS